MWLIDELLVSAFVSYCAVLMGFWWVHLSVIVQYCWHWSVRVFFKYGNQYLHEMCTLSMHFWCLILEESKRRSSALESDAPSNELLGLDHVATSYTVCRSVFHTILTKTSKLYQSVSLVSVAALFFSFRWEKIHNNIKLFNVALVSIMSKIDVHLAVLNTLTNSQEHLNFLLVTIGV